MKKNDYDKIATQYVDTDAKPDKRFSILPTVLSLVGDLNGKVVLDLGCGSGFFTRALAKTALKVVGVDDSEQQLQIAERNQESNVDYVLADFMSDELPNADFVIAPFVFGYCENVDELKKLFERLYDSLSQNGKIVGVIDLPTGQNLKKYGAIKKLNDKIDGGKMEISLTDGESMICTLQATYFTPETIEKLLNDVGFGNVEWHKPIISQEGIDWMPQGFWDGYIENPELGYFTAIKAIRS